MEISPRTERRPFTTQDEGTAIFVLARRLCRCQLQGDVVQSHHHLAREGIPDGREGGREGRKDEDELCSQPRQQTCPPKPHLLLG